MWTTTIKRSGSNVIPNKQFKRIKGVDVKIRELSKMGRRQLRQLSPQHRYSQHRILTYELTIESQYLHQQNVLVGSILILGWGMIDEADGNRHEWRLICFG